jgi:hypothetical protein
MGKRGLRGGLASASAAVIGLLASASGAGAATFSNPAPVAIEDPPSAMSPSEPAVPYPSTIQVGGMNGTVAEVGVTLHGLSHAFLNDVGMMLAGPGGQSIGLMFLVGPTGPVGHSATDLNLVLVDGGPEMQNDAVPTSGTYKPSYPAGVATFPAPAPPECSPGPFELVDPICTFASTFNGTLPNGTWSLYAIDNAGDPLFDPTEGTLAGGWSLQLKTTGGGGGDPEPDAEAPTVRITKAKGMASGKAKVKFTGADDVTPPSGLKFTCKLDRKRAKPCTSPRKYKRLKPGRHRVRVSATDAVGKLSAPAKARFRVPR